MTRVLCPATVHLRTVSGHSHTEEISMIKMWVPCSTTSNCFGSQVSIRQPDERGMSMFSTAQTAMGLRLQTQTKNSGTICVFPVFPITDSAHAGKLQTSRRYQRQLNPVSSCLF